MKFVVDIADNKADSFLQVLKGFTDVKAKPLSAPDAAVLEELNHIKNAFTLADKGKKARLKAARLPNY